MTDRISALLKRPGRSQAVHRGAGTIALGAALTGALVLVLSFVSRPDGGGWWSGALTNAGVALFLFAPLYLATRALDGRIEQVRMNAGENARKVDEHVARLRDDQAVALQELEARINRQRSDQSSLEDEVIDNVRRDPSRGSFLRLHELALDRNWLHPLIDASVIADDGDRYVRVAAAYRYGAPVWTVGSLTSGSERRIRWEDGVESAVFFERVLAAFEAERSHGQSVHLSNILNAYLDLVALAARPLGLKEVVARIGERLILCCDGLRSLDGQKLLAQWAELADDGLFSELESVDLIDTDSLELVRRVVASGRFGPP